MIDKLCFRAVRISTIQHEWPSTYSLHFYLSKRCLTSSHTLPCARDRTGGAEQGRPTGHSSFRGAERIGSAVVRLNLTDSRQPSMSFICFKPDGAYTRFILPLTERLRDRLDGFCPGFSVLSHFACKMFNIFVKIRDLQTWKWK